MNLRCTKLCLLIPTFLLFVAVPAYAMDADGDGHDSIASGGDDCDDLDPFRYPGNVEVCDASNKDEDCDLSTFGERDADGDGFFDANCFNTDTDGTVASRGNDCDDSVRTTHPIATEACDGVDNNCDGAIDNGVSLTLYEDWDLDGHGNPSTANPGMCAGTAGYSSLPNDCDDGNPAIEPGAIVCTGDSVAGYAYCASDGQWVTGQSCAEGNACIAQDNGTGVCVPEKVETKGKDKA